VNLKLFSTALPLFLLPLFSAGAAQAEILSVKATTANFRESPSEKATVKYTADKFYPVEVLEKQAGWMKVKDFEGDVAWVSSKALDSQPSVVIHVERANMRTNPSTSAPVVFKVERGEVFKIEKREGDWLKVVDARGDGGWIRSDMTWGEPEPEKAEKAETSGKAEGAITTEPKAEGAKEAPASKSEPEPETKAEVKVEAKIEPKPLEPMLSTEPNLEALCRAYVAHVDGKKTEPSSTKPTEKKVEKSTDKKAGEKPKPSKGSDKKAPEKASDEKKAPKPKK
jgi:SH3-like domain-containing protein